MRKIATSTALALLLAGGLATPGFAQTSPAPNQAQPQPQAAQPQPMQQAPQPSTPGSMQQGNNAAPNDNTVADNQASSNGVQILHALPSDTVPFRTYYRESVYDNSDNEIGDTNDFLVDTNGKVTTAIIGVGGFLGVGEKNVAVPFEALKVKQEGNGDTHLILDTSKSALEKAPGYTYQDDHNKWVPAKEKSAS